MNTAHYDFASILTAYEQGELSIEETHVLFQYLVNTGLAWVLQGSYGRAAMALIRNGDITDNRSKA